MAGRKVLRILVITACSIALVVFIFQLSLNFFLNKKIIEQLQKQVYESSGGLYHLSVKKIGISLFSQSVSASDVKLVPDTSKAIRQILYSGTAGYIKFTKVSLFKYFFHKDIAINGIELTNPVLRIYRSADTDEKTIDTTRFSLYKLLSGFCSSVEVKEISINNSDIRLFPGYSDTIPVLKSDNNSLVIKNIRVNKAVDEAHRLFIADTFNIAINYFLYHFESDLYDVKCKRFLASYSDSLMQLDSVQLLPLYSRKDFGYAAGKRSDRLNIHSSIVTFHKVNVKAFFERSALLGRRVDIDGLTVRDYRDKNIPDALDSVKSFQKLIRGIRFHINIDSVHMIKADIIYEELAEGNKKPGRLSFNKADVLITGMNNSKELLHSDRKMKIFAKGLLMNAGYAHINYSFPLNTDNMVFDCSGKLSAMPFSAFNPILETNAGLSAKEGVMDSMSMVFHATEKFSVGEMRLFYHNLKAELVNPLNGKQGIVKSFKSLMANKFILKKDNPEKNKPPRTGKIYFVWTPDRFIFNYTWKALLSGIESSIAPGKKVDF